MTAIGLLVVLSAYAICWKCQRNQRWEFCLLSIACVCGSPTAWGYYFTLLMFPAAVMVTEVSPRYRHWLILSVLLMNAMLWPYTPFLDAHAGTKILVYYMPLYGALTLAGLFAATPSRPDAERQ